MTSNKQGGWGPESGTAVEMQSVIRDIISSVSEMDGRAPLKVSKSLAGNVGWLSQLIIHSQANVTARLRAFQLYPMLNETVQNWGGIKPAEHNSVDIDFDIPPTTVVHINRFYLSRLLHLMLDHLRRNNPDSKLTMAVKLTRDKGLVLKANKQVLGLSEVGRKWQPEGGQTSENFRGAEMSEAFLLQQIKGQFSTVEPSSVAVTIPYEAWAGDQVDRAQKTVLFLSQTNTTSHEISNEISLKGFGLILVNNCDDACQVLKTYEIDSLLIDENLDDATTTIVSARLRSEMDEPLQTPILVMTSSGDDTQYEYLEECTSVRVLYLPLTEERTIGGEVEKMILRNDNVSNLDPSADAADTKVSGQLVIDAEVLGSLRGAVGPDVFEELLLKLHADLMVVRAELKSAARSTDLFQIRRSTHVLISLAGSFGATELQMMAQKLNVLANQEKRSEIDRMLAECLHGLELFISFIVEEQSL